MVRALVVAALLGVFGLAQEPAVVREKGRDHFETAFSGGHLRIQIRSGDVRITGSDNDKITIHYEGGQANEIDDVEVRFQRTSAGGDLKMSGGPRNDFHILIEIPRETDLYLRMPFGALAVERIRGGKDIELHAGDAEIEIGDPNDYSLIEASVTTGGLDSPPLGISKGGLFRSFKRDGPGKFKLHAHVGSGELNLR